MLTRVFLLLGPWLQWASPAHQLTTITGSSSSTVSLPVPGSFQPMLQSADGTLFGTVSLPSDLSGNPGPSFMIALDALKKPKWTTPTLSPKYLTNDGNVIAQSQDGTIAATLDQDGNVIGQTGDFGVMYSWTKSMYLPMFLGAFSDGLLRASLTPVDYANTFAATRDGNPSHNASSVQMDLWPSLDHCTSSPGCIGHFEAIYNALDDLILRLRDPDIAALAQTQIFDKLGNDANGFKLTTQSFIKYLSSQRPQFYDALRSTYCYSAFLPPAGKNPICNNAIVSFLFAQKVSRIFQL